MKLQPIGDRILLKVEAAETKTAGGLIIPDTAQEKTQIGKVIAVGDDKDAIKVKKGDRVMFDKYAGTSVKIDGDDHLVVKMQDIIATVN
jgi:chaperonin GroES